MVLDYFNLKEDPFGVTPDPRFLYSSPSHREALASLLYGVRCRRGFMSLVAEPGMGKTTLLFQLLSQLQGIARTVFLFQTLCGPKDLLRSLLHDLGVDDDSGELGHMQERLNQTLLSEARQGRTVVVVVDEAQNLDDSTLELSRTLSNFETTRYKLMQIILAGQPQLRSKLALPHLAQLRQRMSIFCPLHPLTPEETTLYLNHRLQVAGYQRKTSLFTPQAMALIAEFSQGIPRNINNICFNALALGYVLKQKRIGEDVVLESMRDLDLVPQRTDPVGAEIGQYNIVDVPIPQLTAPKYSPLWLKRAAICLVLLLPMLWFAGDGKGATTPVSPPLPDLGLNPASPTPLLPALTTQPGASTGSEQPEENPPDATLHDNSTPASSEKVRIAAMTSGETQELRPQVRASLENTLDPAKLWAEVKNQDTDAEVDLAGLYIEGVGVPKSCGQAQLLLQAASRRGNRRAASELRNLDDLCR